jgi:hypothetical protein
MVFRLDVYVGERDTFGVGFSDNVVFRKQYYVQAFPGEPLEVFVHAGEEHLRDVDPTGIETLREIAEASPAASVQRPARIDDEGADGQGAWTFRVAGTGFTGTFRLVIRPAMP